MTKNLWKTSAAGAIDGIQKKRNETEQLNQLSKEKDDLHKQLMAKDEK